MIGITAFGILIITLTVSIAAVATSIHGAIGKSAPSLESARRSALITFPLLTCVVGALIYLLLSGHFEYAYVLQTTDLSMPVYLKISALWGGQEGSLLFWCWLLSGFTFLALIKRHKINPELLPWVIAITSLTLSFFLFLVIFFENPFLRYFLNVYGEVIPSLIQPFATIQAQPTDGMGLNPLLRHFGMVVHPPMLYLGYASFVIPYAFATAALIRGRSDEAWIRTTQKWSLTAWIFLSIGLVLGSRWAYDVLGWGGYWGWDPVEISALMPWLTGTAYLHSSLVQEKRGIFKHWNIFLIILTFCLVILSTFLTRSGMLSSVHAFSESGIGVPFFVFVSVMFTLSLALLWYRWQNLDTGYHINSFFSRESLFLFNIFLFIAIFLICLTGILFPILSELVTGQQVTVGPPFYESATGPLFALLLVLMGIAPLSVWGASNVRSLGRAVWKPAAFSLVFPLLSVALGVRNGLALIAVWSAAIALCIILFDLARSLPLNKINQPGTFWQTFFRINRHNRRRNGGLIVHLGVALMGLGIIGIEFFQTQTQQTIHKDDTIEIAGYTLTYENLQIQDTVDGREVAQAKMLVSKDSREIGWLFPRRDYYYDSQQTVTVPDVHSTLAGDLYITLVDWLPITSEGATFKVYYNPLINWLWIGTLTLVAGTLLALFPVKEKVSIALEDKKDAA